MSTQTQTALTRLSRGHGPAMHRYYDVRCESPDGTRLLYFEFDGPVPGPGTVFVAHRDGSNAQAVGRCEGACYGHVGANATWISDHQVWFMTGGQFHNQSRLVRLDTGSAQDLSANIRAFHEGTGLAALTVSDPAAGTDEFTRRRRFRVDRLHVDSGAVSPLLTIEQAVAAHPQRDRLTPERMNFMNTKWSPDGATLSVVFTDQIYCSLTREPRRTKCLILVDADGGNVRYLTEFNHHPMWAPDSSFILAHHPGTDGQELRAHPVNGAASRVLLDSFVGIHTSLDRAMERVVTDAFDFEETGRGAVLLYELRTGRREVLAAGPHERHDHESGTHIHPQWSRDESRILFNLAADGTPQLYAVDVQ